MRVVDGLVRLEPAHDSHIPEKCKVCKKCYKGVIRQTKKIKNKKIREELLKLFETLWLNRCDEFDIIYYELNFDVFNAEKRGIEK